MNNINPKFNLLAIPTDRFAARRNVLRSMCLWLLLGFFGGAAAQAADVPTAPTNTSIGPGPSFAIADFDGDARPDSARIQPGPGRPDTTNYWIQFDLSASGRRGIHLVGPAGGLQIQARDINGDDAVDLVVTTKWFSQPVAILLNDGHGSFARFEPAEFPQAFRESSTNWNARLTHAADAAGVPPQSGVGIWGANASAADLAPRRSLVPDSSFEFVLTGSLTSYAGRAPPSQVTEV